MDFSNDNLESGFLYAATNLYADDLPGWAASKMQVLKNDAGWVEQYRDQGDMNRAAKALDRILPGFL